MDSPRPNAFVAGLATRMLATGLLASAAAARPAPAPTPLQARATATAAGPATKLLRFPDIHGEHVVFSYAGDLWRASSSGGAATRLTAHPGLELFPKISPDGKWVAFTGQYDGDEQVYVVPLAGGVPEQLTFYPARGPLPPRWGYDNQVYGWTPDSSRVLFRSMREGWDLTDTRLYTVPIVGGPASALPMPVAGGGDLSPDGTKVVYSPLTRDFRSWKRYEGGWAQDLFIFDLAASTQTPVAHHVRTERDPMWIGDKVYFASDRTGTLNLFEFDPANDAVAQLTNSRTWDVRWPSKGEDGEIVYESEGALRVYDTRSKSDRALSIFVPDDGLASRPSRVSAADQIDGFGLSPKGERALFTARGDVFTAPIEKGATRNLTRSSGAHDRAAQWSPDGRSIAYISDATGEDELWLVAQDGATPAEQLTTGGDQMLFGLSWSPTGEHIAFHDKSNRLRVLTLASKAVTEVARNLGGGVGDATWSPDGAWLAFSLTDENSLRSLYIWGTADGQSHRITGELFAEYEPVWDPAGKYLYYLSDREFAPQLFTGFEWNFAVNRTTGIYALALRKDVGHPLPPESDEVALESADKAQSDQKQGASEEADGDAAPKQPTPISIDFDGLAQRVTRLPIEADNLSGLTANAGHLFYTRSGAPYYGRESERETALMVFDFESRKASALVDGIGGYTLSPAGTKLLVAAQGGFALYDAKAGAADSKKEVSTGELYVDGVPREEWDEVFRQVWRRFRDFFYVENMHGYDWDGLRAQYEALLPFVGHRSDLNYVISEMIGELNIGHAYVTGGDWYAPERPRVALLGARFALDPATGRYRIARILAGQNEEERYRSPLTEVGVDVKEGEYLLAVDGVELTGATDPYRVLRHRAGRPVELTVGATADLAAARKVQVNPITSESELNYLAFVLRNRERVAQLSNGRLAYVHIPDMGEDGIREFIKWYYGQIRKDGLIVDDRNNGGGNVSQMVLERLRRTLLSTGFSRNSEYVGTYPSAVFTGPMVCLLNENSASDGDIFPWMFKTSKLGPLIGKRSWGGVVGITSHGPLIDGGSCNVPEFGNNDAQGQWAVEGHGVDPDIVVENDAASILAGRDPQLERAVEEVLKLCATQPAKLPQRPAPPVKTPALGGR
ncbi:MAG: S41 family peptidase [Planctomycetota bacterium]